MCVCATRDRYRDTLVTRSGEGACIGSAALWWSARPRLGLEGLPTNLTYLGTYLPARWVHLLAGVCVCVCVRVRACVC